LVSLFSLLISVLSSCKHRTAIDWTCRNRTDDDSSYGVDKQTDNRRTNGRMEAVGISDKRGLTWTPQPERTLTTLYLHRPTRCSPRPSPDSSFASSFQQATDLLSHGPSVHGWRVCAQPIQPPLLDLRDAASSTRRDDSSSSGCHPVAAASSTGTAVGNRLTAAGTRMYSDPLLYYYYK
jgi:hypothetical protein